MQVERKILEMLLQGSISLEEALGFLEDLKPKERKKGFFSRKVPKVFTTVHLKVNDPSIDEKTDVKIPLSLLKTGLKILKKEVEELGIDETMIDELMQAIKEGQNGLILDVKSSEGLDIEVYIL